MTTPTSFSAIPVNPPPAVPVVSVVVIGRNEGERLMRCLHSVQQANWQNTPFELIYVDSRSTDHSPAQAAALGARVLVVDDARPNAAKARNLGWQAANGAFILFLDGDTELHPDFVQHAMATLQAPHLCAAWGHRRESKPGQSLYTRVLDLDWVYPVGRTLYFGGDVLVRRAALAGVDGFDPSLNAGEEPELCARLRAAGWGIEHMDVPMTRHDLAVTTLRAYWRRAYRSGIAYAEVAQRMRVRGDVLWQHESRRDFQHAVAFMLSPLLLAATLWLQPLLALGLLALAAVLVARTVVRCAWKAPGQWLLCTQYAVHVHSQKIPALFGQLKWHQAQRQQAELALVDYKENAPATDHSLKAVLATVLTPLAWLQRSVVQRALRVWHLARLQEGIGQAVHSSNVILGAVELHGSRNITLGRNALIYPGVYLETQGSGRITLGDNVVLSRGVHIVAFEQVTLGDNCMVGEYSSLRDANHTSGSGLHRASSHRSAPISVGVNAWLGRGVTVLKGASIGHDSVVGANAVVTRSIAAQQRVGGIPARPLPAV
ncbi:MAG: glycosyltransferase [Rhodoferax sp.]